jgi:hypothetical protein
VSWFDDLLEVGTMFDWISPVLSIAGDIANGGGYTLFIPQACGWTGGEVDRLLRRNGIKTWGKMIVNGFLMITVRPAQAEQARFVLNRAGVPLDNGSPSGATEPRGGRW